MHFSYILYKKKGQFKLATASELKVCNDLQLIFFKMQPQQE